MTVANLDSRVGWIEGPPFGGGQWTFFFRGDTAAFQEVLIAFAAIQSDRLEVVLHDGSVNSPFIKRGDGVNDDGHYDWSFEVWVPENWNRLYNDPQSFFSADQPNFRQPVAAPRLETWLGSAQLDWEHIRIPANVTVLDNRASAHGFKPGTGSAVRAKVTDLATGQPIAKVTLAAFQQGERTKYETVAQAEGTEAGLAVLSQLGEGRYLLVASATGYEPRLLEYARLGTNDYREFAVGLARPTELEGTVLDESGGPLAGVAIKAIHTLGSDGKAYPLLEPPEAVSDSKGQFRLKGLPSGSLQIWAVKASYHQRWNPRELVPAEDDAPLCTLRMEATGTVRIQLMDENGRPLMHINEGEVQVHIEATEGAKIGSWGGGANVGTNGTYEFSEVPPGQYRVSTKFFVLGQAQAHSEVISVEANKTTDVHLVHQ